MLEFLLFSGETNYHAENTIYTSKPKLCKILFMDCPDNALKISSQNGIHLK
jgi:hypothetical protein